jgi:hypothetical protein
MIDSEILEAGSHSGSDVQDPGNITSNNLGGHREMAHQLGVKEEACHINKEAEEKYKEDEEGLKFDLDTLAKLRLFLKKYVVSTMPEAKNWVERQGLAIRVIDAVLRGIGEVAFMNNSISGLVIIIGIFLSSWEFGVAMIIGSLVSLLTAKFFKLNDNLISNGIYGYNAVALQIGIAQYHSRKDGLNFEDMPYIIIPIFLMSMLSTIMIAGIGMLFVKVLRLSPLELPSILSTWIWILGAQ